MLGRLFPEVRPLERQRFSKFFILFALLLAGLAVGATTAESLLLSRLGVQALPTAMLAASIATMLGSSLYSRWVSRWRNETFFVAMLVAASVVLALAIPLVRARFEWAYYGLFCFNWLTFTLFFTHYFSLLGDYFDTLASKRLLPLFVVGSTCGEIGGGLSASVVSKYLGAEGLLFLWLIFQLAAALFLWRSRGRLREWNPLVARPQAARRVKPNTPSGWDYLKRSRLAKALALMTAGLMVSNTVVVYLHADIFLRSFPSEAELASFLGMFVALTNIAELFLGAKVTPWLVRKLGVAQANLVHPIGALITLLILSSHYTLWAGMLAWMNRKMLQDFLGSPVRSMLYSAIPARFRGPVRANIDGVFGAGSQALASLALGLVQTQIRMTDLVWVGVLVTGVYVFSAWRVRGVYLQTLVDDLSQGQLMLASPPSVAPAPIRPGLEEEGRPLGALPEVDLRGLEALSLALTDSRAEVVLAAIARLRDDPDPLAIVLLARGLESGYQEVRLAAATALTPRGDSTLPHLERYFRSAQTATVESAYEAVAGGSGLRGRQMLAQELRILVREAWRHLFLAEALTQVETPADALLGLALDDHCDRCRRLAFKCLSLLEGEHLMAPVMSSLRFAKPASRANAMEVLSNLGDREAAGLLVLLTEDSSRQDKLAAAGRLLPELRLSRQTDRAMLWDRCAHSSGPFVRRAAMACRLGRVDVGLQRMSQIKMFELFAELSLEQLEDLSSHLLTERFMPGEIVCEQSAPGDRLYLCLSGRFDPDEPICGLTPLLDGGTQRFTVRAQETTTCWSLSGRELFSAIARHREIGLAIFGRLARQLKQQEEKIRVHIPRT